MKNVETVEQYKARLYAAYKIVAADMENTTPYIRGKNKDISSDEFRAGADEIFKIICQRGGYVPNEKK